MSPRREYRVDGLPEPISHYADAVATNGLHFVPGVVPVDAEGRLVGGDDVVAQARAVFESLHRVLAAAGARPADVVKVTVYLTNVDDRPLINPVRREFFGETRPASTLVEVSRLAIPGARLEVEAVAELPRCPRRREFRVAGQPELAHSAHAVRASGDLLFVNGVLPVDGAGALVGGDDVTAQAERVFASMGEILAAAGASFADVAKLTVFLTDVGDRPAIAGVRERVFGGARPASTLVGVAGLAVPGAKIEAECVAVLAS